MGGVGTTVPFHGAFQSLLGLPWPLFPPLQLLALGFPHPVRTHLPHESEVKKPLSVCPAFSPLPKVAGNTIPGPFGPFYVGC